MVGEISLIYLCNLAYYFKIAIELIDLTGKDMMGFREMSNLFKWVRSGTFSCLGFPLLNEVKITKYRNHKIILIMHQPFLPHSTGQNLATLEGWEIAHIP